MASRSLKSLSDVDNPWSYVHVICKEILRLFAKEKYSFMFLGLLIFIYLSTSTDISVEVE